MVIPVGVALDRDRKGSGDGGLLGAEVGDGKRAEKQHECCIQTGEFAASVTDVDIRYSNSKICVAYYLKWIHT